MTEPHVRALALELFRNGGRDIESAYLEAASQERERLRQLGQRLEADERPGRTWTPPAHRMVGPQRNG